MAPNLVSFVTVLLALFGYNMYATILATKTGRTRLESIVASIEHAVFAIVAVALFPSLFFCAQKAALADARAIRCGATSAVTRVVLSFKPGRATTYESDFISAISLGPVYLLARTEEAYYVLYQPAAPPPATLRGPATPPSVGRGFGCGCLSAARTYEILKGDIDHIMTVAPTIYR